MKKLLILLFSILISFNSYSEEVELDFSSGTFCDKSPKAQVRNGLFYLPNQEEPYSGENLCVYLSNGQYYSQGEIKNGLRTSKWTYWKENGQREKVEYYKDGESVGEKMVSMQLLNARALYLSYAADSNNVGAYDKLIKEHPSSSYVDQATLLMAKYLFDAGSYSLALDVIKPLMNNQSSIIASTAVLRTASIYLQLGQHDEALSTLNIESGEGFSGLIYNLTGDVYLDLGNFNEAKKYYGLAIENITENSNLTQLIQIKLDDLNGIQDYDSRSANTAIASVDGEEILLTTYYQELNLQQRNLQEQLGSSYSAEIDNALRQTLIDTLINEKLLENYANSLELVTLDEEVRALIQSNEVFQVEGVFSEERYNQLLRLNNYTPLSYERAQAESMTQDQLKRNLVHSAFLTYQQIEKLKALAGQQRYTSFIVLNTEEYKDQMSVTQDQVIEYFDTNQSSFVELPKIKVNYVKLSLDNIEQQIDPDNETLQKLYIENEKLYTNPEQRRAQHILLEEVSNASAILKEIKQGGDFSELARIHSKDITTSEIGGDLGLFERELMVPEFDKAVFDMNVGDISDVVKSDYGYHIIKLNEIQPATLQSFEEVEEQLLALHKKNVNQKALYELQEELSNLAYEESIDVVSNQLDLELQTSDFFSELSTEYDEVFVSTAFSDIVLNDGENSDVIELSKDRFIVMSLTDQQPERQKVLDEVEDQIVDILRNLGAKQLIDELAQTISSSLRSGDDAQVKALMSENNLEWNEVGWITRSSQLPFNVTSEVYKLSKPNTGEHTYHSQSADTNTTLVIDLKAVKLSEEDINSEIIDLYLSEENNELFLSLVKKLRDSAEIKVFSELL